MVGKHRDILTTIFCREINATYFTSLIKVGGGSRNCLTGSNSFFSTCLLKAHLLRCPLEFDACAHITQDSPSDVRQISSRC
ncbi:hypothetical protein OUZ56_008984 [Daphnia magna]|uniref:Uncharacterized protein n=1 Tax=Daphnia magna TaxID=35525 RepID=A0ABR0AEP4_9CRUS|nr:hypothetical protein OUZ56_008984 [Daphnia magna]